MPASLSLNRRSLVDCAMLPAKARKRPASPLPPTQRLRGTANVAADLHGAGRLMIDAVKGITDVVEDLHHSISRMAPITGHTPAGRTKGITGFVYRSVRGVTHGVGIGLDVALSRLWPLVGGRRTSERREAVLAVTNGIVGDYLAATDNPLAIRMSLRQRGVPLVLERDHLRQTFSAGNLLIMVHGLCMNDRQWQRNGHDHGVVLGQVSGHTVLYLHYNSGRHIGQNGRDFASLLQTLVEQWPVVIESIRIVGHSMGGLVTRSACEVAKLQRQQWLKHLKAIVFLGSPHHGAPLERAGNWFNTLLAVSPYTAPFVRLAGIRSAGIQDLRHGTIIDQPLAQRALRMPSGVLCFAIAATNSKRPANPRGRLTGDGLVPVASALGQSPPGGADLRVRYAFPASRRAIFYAHGHFDLLSSAPVCDKIRTWLFALNEKPVRAE